MLRNYLLIAWRNLKRHQVFSLINVLGLSIGMAAGLLILQYVTFQTSFDRFHANASRLYRVVLGKEVPGRWVTPYGLAPLLKEEFPQVQQVTRMEPAGTIIAAVGQAVFKETTMYLVEPSFLRMFSFPLQKGNPSTALSQPNSVVISPKIAQKYFGPADPMGKVIRLNGETDFSVTGLLKEIPSYSHLQFDFLLSYVSVNRDFQEKTWGSRGIPTYILLAPGANPQALAKALPNAVKKHTQENKELGYFWLQPVTDIHTSAEIKESNGVDPTMLYFLLSLAVFILAIAWINYINLSTARATQRAKEVGVRKAMGAARFQLFRQFLLESVLLNGLAVVVAFTIVQVSLPYFRQLTGLQLSLTLWNDPVFWLSLLSIFAVGTVLSGMYPALILSSFKPLAVLKGVGIRTASRGGIRLRQALVVFQFATCIGLIIGTAAVYQQLSYMRNQSLGIDLEQTLVLHSPQLVGDSITKANRWTQFKEAMLATGLIQSLTTSNALPSRGFNSYSYTSVVGQPPNDQSKFETYSIVRTQANFFQTYELSLLAGRTFSEQLPTDDRTVVLNAEAARRLGFPDANQIIGRQIELDGKYTVIGVIKDYHHDHLASTLR